MRGHLILLILIFLLIPTILADNLGISLYSMENGNRKYGNIYANPGDNVETFILIRNENSEKADNTEINSISVKSTIEEIDNGENIEEEYNDFDLQARREKSLPLNLKIPLLIDLDTYTIKIDIAAIENNIKFKKTEDFLLNINRKEHQLYIDTIKFNPNFIQCNQVSKLDVIIYNIGLSGEEAIMQIINEDLAVNVKKIVDLPKGGDTYKDSIPVKVSKGVKEGTYLFEVILTYGTPRLSLIKNASLNIKCDNIVPLNKIDSQTQLDEPIQESVVQKNIPPTTEIPQKNVSFLPIYIILGLVLLCIFIIIILKLK
jgi:hypothetical protein